MIRRATRKLAEDVAVNLLSTVIIFVLLSSAEALINTLLNPRAAGLHWLEGLLIGNSVLFCVGIVLWLQPAIRFRALAFSQRRTGPGALLALGLVTAGLFAAAIVLVIPLDTPAAWENLSRQQVAYLAGAGVGIVIALAGVIGLICHRAMRITPDYCYRVLVALNGQRKTGRYKPSDGDRHMTAFDVRRQCRILDVLSAHDPAKVAPGFALDVRRKGARYTVTEVGKPAGEAGVDFPFDPELRFWFWANKLWELGSRSGAWRAKGTADARGQWDASKARDGDFARKNLFGNQLDQLFNGGEGLRTYGRFTTMVIRGQPGAGKSTLALQMCVTLARQGYATLYFSLEEDRDSLIQSARNYGWYEPAQFAAADGSSIDYLGLLHHDYPVDTAKRANAQGQFGYVLVSSLGHRAMSLNERKSHLRRFWDNSSEDEPQSLRCAVIDSLEGFANVGLEGRDDLSVPRSDLLELKEILSSHCDLLVLLVEDNGDNKPRYLDFVADVVIKLGRSEVDGYTLLFAEVVKARNQRHALGPSQIKFRDIKSTPPPILRGKLDRSVSETGIVLYPSLHYRLYQSGQLPSFGDYLLSTGLPGLDELLAAAPQAPGIRRQSTTALLGPAGTAKSLLAMNFLIEGMRENTRTLFISLRDHSDITTARTVPQDPDLMRYSRQRDDRARRYMHQFEWTLSGIERWVQRSNGDPLPLRLPYLFTDPPVAFREFRDDPHVSSESEATKTFLKRLATLYRERGTAVRDNDFADIWQLFLGDLAEKVPDWRERPRLLHVGMLEAPMSRSAQEIVLVRRENDGEPGIRWHGPSWDEKSTPGDDLLTVIHQRPGNITPEEFIDLVLRTIGYAPGQQHESPFERVVFDDVSQIAQRFPMLASSRLFLPTLIDAFKANGMTALFLADTAEPFNVQANMGLPVIADHVLWTTLQSASQQGVHDAYGERGIQVEVLARPSPGREPRYLLISARGESQPTLTVESSLQAPGK